MIQGTPHVEKIMFSHTGAVSGKRKRRGRAGQRLGLYLHFD